jgi:hypothetical protein
MGVSNRKKSRVIHVDKLIIHADDVIVTPKGRIRDPWLFPRRSDVEAIEDVHKELSHDDHEHDDHKHDDHERDDREEGRRPFSWI